MIGVLFRFQVEDQWWETEDAKRGRAEYPAFEAGCNSILQNSLWGARSEAQIVGQIVEKFLDADWCFQSAQLTRLRLRETEAFSASHDRSSNIADLFSLLLLHPSKKSQSFI